MEAQRLKELGPGLWLVVDSIQTMYAPGNGLRAREASARCASATGLLMRAVPRKAGTDRASWWGT